MVDVTYDEVLEQALQLTAAEQLRLSERLAEEADKNQPINGAHENDNEPPLTEDEIKYLLSRGPKTGAEIAESDAVGGWLHLSIADGAEWVNEQKRKRLERKKW